MTDDDWTRQLQEELDDHQRLPLAHQDDRLLKRLRQSLTWAKETPMNNPANIPGQLELFAVTAFDPPLPTPKPITGTNVVSFSGGRTSAYLVWLMEQARHEGADVHYVFMDTGAEHPATYAFIRNIVAQWGIPLVCLRAVLSPEMGVGPTYRVVDVADIGPDLAPWREMLKIYGAPDVSRPHCTGKMKTIPHDKYCNERFGKGNYTTWLGIRGDEPNRLGERPGVRFLAELSRFKKQDVLNWWAKQPFDLGIMEHLGNCTFCIKKSLGKVALATRDEPELAAQFVALTEGPEVRTEGLMHQHKRMYREYKTLTEVSQMFPESTRDELFSRLKMAHAFDTGACAESCEVFTVGVE